MSPSSVNRLVKTTLSDTVRVKDAGPQCTWRAEKKEGRERGQRGRREEGKVREGAACWGKEKEVGNVREEK